MAELAVLAGVLVLSAIGLTGFLVEEDYCLGDDLGYRLWPPGMTCTPADGSVGSTPDDTGSVAGLLFVLLVDAAVMALAVRHGRQMSGPIRVATVTVAVFALLGIGALVGGAAAALGIGVLLGIPLAFLLHLGLQPSRRPWTFGIPGALVALYAVVGGAVLWLLELELLAFLLPLLSVAAIAALTERRKT